MNRPARWIARFFSRGAPAKRLAAAALLALGGLSVAAQAQDAAYSEDEVKAAFLYHFGTYVEWPATNARRTDPLTIAVLGANAVAAQLRNFLPGRTIQGRPVEVRSLARIQDLRDDEVLFIGEENNSHLSDLIDAVGTRPVLIVTDAASDLADGAMVNFQLVDRRVRFEISLRKAQDSGLILSSRLLSAALRVETSSCWSGCRDVIWPPSPDLAQARSRPRPEA
jgi:YfiR/HmsC-like